MLAVISPAKTLDFDTPPATESFTLPSHLAQSRKLVRRLRELSADDLGQLMGISDNLALTNHRRYRKWKTPFRPDNARQAIYAFKGDVYLGLDAASLDSEHIEFAQSRLRILSGLYGLLRPLDLVQAYRLEMGTRLDTPLGSNLYQFWGDRITRALNKDLKESRSKVLLNLASDEYFKAVQTNKIRADIITPAFRELRGGEYRFIQFFAKKARGLMARYLIEHAIDDPEALKDFDYQGYRYNSDMSDGASWFFTRAQ